MFVNSGATDIVLVTLSSTAVETAIAQCTSRWEMARGHRLNTAIVLAAVHGLSGPFRAVSAVEPFTLSPPSHSVPIPNRPSRLCGRKATQNHNLVALQLSVLNPQKSIINKCHNWVPTAVVSVFELVHVMNVGLTVRALLSQHKSR